jgi:four helix bundle protein
MLARPGRNAQANEPPSVKMVAPICRSQTIFRPMAGSIRDLKVWQEAVSLAAETVRSARQNARRETKVVTDQIMLCALAAAGAIADGYGRYTAPEQRQLYRTAKRELLKLETQLAVARQADILSAPAHADLSSRIQGVNRLLAGYLVYLERQLTPEGNGR